MKDDTIGTDANGSPVVDAPAAPAHPTQSLAAHTGEGSDNPSYANISLMSDGRVAVTVRGPVTEGHQGPVATHIMGMGEFAAFVHELAKMGLRW